MSVNKLTLETDGLAVGAGIPGQPTQLLTQGGGVVMANVTVTNSLTCATGWTGTASAAGQLGGIPIAFTCERNSTGSVGQNLGFGGGSTTGSGIVMPFSGKLYLATLGGAGVLGIVTVVLLYNNSVNTAYTISQQNIKNVDFLNTTANWFTRPFSFNAGDLIGWQQTTAPSQANAFNVTFYVVYN
jgi:hypothetical protein